MSWFNTIKGSKKDNKLVVTLRFKEWLEYRKNGGKQTWLQWGPEYKEHE